MMSKSSKKNGKRPSLTRLLKQNKNSRHNDEDDFYDYDEQTEILVNENDCENTLPNHGEPAIISIAEPESDKYPPNYGKQAVISIVEPEPDESPPSYGKPTSIRDTIKQDRNDYKRNLLTKGEPINVTTEKDGSINITGNHKKDLPAQGEPINVTTEKDGSINITDNNKKDLPAQNKLLAKNIAENSDYENISSVVENDFEETVPAYDTPNTVINDAPNSEEKLVTNNSPSELNSSRHINSSNTTVNENSENLKSLETAERNKQLNKNTSPYEVAKLLVEKGHKFLFLDKRLYMYDERFGFYKIMENDMEAGRSLRQILPEKLRSWPDRYKIDELIRTLESHPGLWFNTTPSPRLTYRYLNFRNGILEYSTNRRLSHTPNIFFDNYVNADYPFDGSECEGKYFEEFIQYISNGDNEVYLLLQEVLGLMISDIRHIKKAVFFLGIPHSGKTTLLELIGKIIGTPFYSNLNFNDLIDKFRLARLLGKKFNYAGEKGENYIKSAEIFKQLTGGDSFTVEKKYTDSFSMHNKALLAFGSNNLPKLKTLEISTAFFDRMLIVPFLRTIPEYKFNWEIKEKLFTERSFIVHFAIQGLKRLMNNNYVFTKSRLAEDIKSKYINEYNSFESYARQCLDFTASGYTYADEIEEDYHNFCDRTGLKALDKKTWHNLLEIEYNCRYKKKHSKIKNGMAFWGVIIKNTCE